MTQAWITGAKGFIGRHLAHHLSQQGVTVHGIGHGAWMEEDRHAWGVSGWINGDIHSSNLDALLDSNSAPDMIFHLAGGSSVGLSISLPHEDFHRTVNSAVQLLEWVRLKSLHCNIVFASSAAVYGAGHDSPIKEGDMIHPYSPYGYHKHIVELLFESYAHNFGLNTSIVRLFSVYGPYLRKQLLWDVCTRLYKSPKANLQLSGTGNEVRDWLHVYDAVRLLKRTAAIAGVECPIVNGGNGEAKNVRDVVESLLRSFSMGGNLKFGGVTRSGDPAYLVADISRIRDLGFKSEINWKEGVAEYAEWFKKEGVVN